MNIYYNITTNEFSSVYIDNERVLFGVGETLEGFLEWTKQNYIEDGRSLDDLPTLENVSERDGTFYAKYLKSLRRMWAKDLRRANKNMTPCEDGVTISQVIAFSSPW